MLFRSGVGNDEVVDRESVPINVREAVEELRCGEDEGCVFLDVGELNGATGEEFRSVVDGGDGEGLGGEGLAAVRVRNDVVEGDGAVEVSVWREGVTGGGVTGDGACIGGESFYRESRGEGFNVREAGEEVSG